MNKNFASRWGITDNIIKQVTNQYLRKVVVKIQYNFAKIQLKK